MSSRYFASNTNNNPYDNRNYFKPSEQRMTDFKKFTRRYEINETFARKLLGLDGYEIVFICDDSGSMNTPLGDVHGPYDNAPTRWDELRQTVSIVVDLASALDPNGVDVYFLNREPIRNVRHSSELTPNVVFLILCGTPIARVLREVLREKQHEIETRNLLVLIATDGVPTDEQGHTDIQSLERVLKYERNPPNRIPVTIIACTDDDDCMDYLNDWDVKIPNLDVVDDYKNEKKQIQACQGKQFPFSFGDYIVKILMGGIDSWFDDLDEKKVSLDGYRSTQSITNN